MQSTLSHLHCETLSVILSHKESLISKFNLWSTNLYLTYSVCTQFTQSASGLSDLHLTHSVCIWLTQHVLSSLSLHLTHSVCTQLTQFTSNLSDLHSVHSVCTQCFLQRQWDDSLFNHDFYMIKCSFLTIYIEIENFLFCAAFASRSWIRQESVSI